MNVEAIVGFERFVALAAVKLPNCQMGLHVGHQQRLLDEFLRTVEALEFSLGCVRSNMFIALILVLEQDATDMTSKATDVGVLQMVDLQTLIRPELVAADFAFKFLFVVHHLMRPLRVLVGKCFATARKRAGEGSRNVAAVNVKQFVLLEVACGAERLLAIRKAALEFLSRVDSAVRYEIRLDVEARLALFTLERFVGFVELSMNFQGFWVLIRF